MKQHFVCIEYVIGSLLVFPIIHFHLIPITRVSSKVQASPAAATQLPLKAGGVKVKSGKRTCGQSQKSARLALKARKQKKRPLV